MKIPILLATLSLMLGFSPILRASEPLQPGSPAPALTLPDQNGTPFDLSKAYASGIVLVYFYPKADTPGCTAQACSLRDSIESLKDLGITVIGVSRDTPEAQKRFAQRHNLPFTLLSDQKGELQQAFGVGSLFGMPRRVSFLIKDAKIAVVFPNAQTSHHADEVKAALKNLNP